MPSISDQVNLLLMRHYLNKYTNNYWQQSHGKRSFSSILRQITIHIVPDGKTLQSTNIHVCLHARGEPYTRTHECTHIHSHTHLHTHIHTHTHMWAPYQTHDFNLPHQRCQVSIRNLPDRKACNASTIKLCQHLPAIRIILRRSFVARAFKSSAR